MKNGLLIWNVLLSLVAGFLLIRQFSSTSKKTDKASIHKDTSGEKFLMAYFEMDSISANYEMVKEVKTELAKKEEDDNGVLDGLAKKFQQKFLYYQKLAQDGKLSQTQSDSANIEMKRLDDEMKMRKQQLDQEYNDLMARRQNEIKTRIETYLKDYNKDRNYSYIVSYEQGLFYYKDTMYNITSELLRGLNQMYKASAKR